ncbi:serine aminopeptidase domain-containing protein [Mucilaginibacter sp. FT3.2]|uniref:serine aminopeptidase domain-containing protein n=1 Tax=Mucilaginibacter sp. FT3.2 TaxID=2723090 RepID=UPI00161D6392|nr:alpha/beta hydrolase [Mucilaginibacter sp. FT3.2]MBB6231436.1 pimeloyl-ACP methyl ester carboxylesterase [Mucilaginibacter sp. FT3.2]
MKKVSFLILIICLATKLFAQTEPSNYKVALSRFKHLYNNNQPDSIFNFFSPEMKTALPQESFRSTTKQLRTQLGDLQNADFVNVENSVAAYKATFKNGIFLLNIGLNAKDQYTGLLLKPYTTAATATPAAAESVVAFTMDPSITETPVSVKNLAGDISGTLAMPKNATGKVPVVLIIAGSGPTDRDGNSPKLGLASNSYKMIANELGKSGIASLRYDKRLVGKSVSSTTETQLRFEDYVEDAVNLINFLNEDERFSRVIVLGHSEGSLVGMLASVDEPVKAFVSVAGAGDSADNILTEQMKSQPTHISDGFKRMLDSLKRGKTTDNIDPSLYFIARPGIQKYLMSWFRYNPAREIRKLKVPVLIIQGNTDLQVKVADAEKLKKGKSDAILEIIPEMNHILKEAPADKDKNMATYNQPDLPLKPEFVKALIPFVKRVR